MIGRSDTAIKNRWRSLKKFSLNNMGCSQDSLDSGESTSGKSADIVINCQVKGNVKHQQLYCVCVCLCVFNRHHHNDVCQYLCASIFMCFLLLNDAAHLGRPIFGQQQAVRYRYNKHVYECSITILNSIIVPYIRTNVTRRRSIE